MILPGRISFANTDDFALAKSHLPKTNSFFGTTPSSKWLWVMSFTYKTCFGIHIFIQSWTAINWLFVESWECADQFNNFRQNFLESCNFCDISYGKEYDLSPLFVGKGMILALNFRSQGMVAKIRAAPAHPLSIVFFQSTLPGAQVSVLGPLLFNISLNDIYFVLNHNVSI